MGQQVQQSVGMLEIAKPDRAENPQASPIGKRCHRDPQIDELWAGPLDCMATSVEKKGKKKRKIKRAESGID